ncbi:ABC transporter permease [Rhodococcus koreensis]
MTTSLDRRPAVTARRDIDRLRPTIPTSRMFWRVIAALSLLTVWSLASGLIGRSSLPGPAQTVEAVLDLATSPTFWVALAQTLIGTVIGLATAAAVAVPLGLAIGASRFAIESSRITIDFFASIPPVSFLPLALLLYGPSMAMKLMLVIYGVGWLLLVRTIDAVRDIDPHQREVADAFGLPTSVRWSRIYLPASLPGILVGLRISFTFALLLAVSGEYIGGATGIGAQLMAAQVSDRPADALALAVIAALLGMTLNIAMNTLSRLAIGWHPSMRIASTS